MIAECQQFHQEIPESGDSVTKFVASLKKLLEYCQFGQVLSDALWDNFVAGLHNDQIQKKLLTPSTLTFKMAVELTVAWWILARETEDVYWNKIKSIWKVPLGL